jgi:hypothetical protein
MAKAKKAAKKAKTKRRVVKKSARAKAKPSVRRKKTVSKKPAPKRFLREISPLKELTAQEKAPLLLPPPAKAPTKGPERIAPEGIEPIVPKLQISVPGKGAPLSVGFDLVPPWQDKERLISFMKDEGISFSTESAGSEASSFLSSAGKETDAGANGYFLIRAEQAGLIIGAIDGYLTQDSVVFLRSKSQIKKRRELHTLLFCAAMTLLKAQSPAPKAAIYICPRAPFSQELAGRLLFLGRRAGMQAIPVESQGMLFFIRRFGKEHDLIGRERDRGHPAGSRALAAGRSDRGARFCGPPPAHPTSCFSG